MNTKIRYAALGLLAVSGLYTGLWAYFSPLNVVLLSALVVLSLLLLVPSPARPLPGRLDGGRQGAGREGTR
ncbi:hypothetical protein ACFRR7_25545 [Streptomyces sp. NPDC056909]|uniref:hypothetical protein n=1 Tax=unclassified Streptomyces TaxID=2593676 RepID=UPI003428A05F